MINDKAKNSTSKQKSNPAADKKLRLKTSQNELGFENLSQKMKIPEVIS